VAAITTAGVAALTTAQAQALTTAGVAALTTAQTVALTTADVAALTTAQVQALTTRDVAALTTSQVSAFTTTEIGALSTSQVRALTTGDIAALSTSQITGINTTDIVALTTAQVVAITTADIRALTTTQVQALTTTEVQALTTAQFAAFTTSQVPYLNLSTPLVLDLNGHGSLTQNIAAGVKFDLFGTGEKVNTGWVASGNGLLVLDRNGNGSIDSGAELFGSATTLADGSKANNGYAALAELDSNHDGKVTASDAGFSSLEVWVDGNSDGVSSTAELHSLASLGITSLSLNTSSDISKDNGNFVTLGSSYQTADGSSHGMADVVFVANNPIAQQVSGMAHAISHALGDDSASSASAGSLRWTPKPSGGTEAGAASSATPVRGMVDAMRHYDANGQFVSHSSTLSAATALGKSMGLPGLENPLAHVVGSPGGRS
jgi:hypothetical protein